MATTPPIPELTQDEDETWTLRVPGVCATGGHPAPEWAMAAAVAAVQKAAADAVRRWQAGKPVTAAEQAVVHQAVQGEKRIYAWLDGALVDDPARSRRR